MLAVDRNDRHALFRSASHDGLSGHHHHFLRGKRDVHALLNRGKSRLEAGRADRRDQADVGVAFLHRPRRGVFADVGDGAEFMRKRFAFLPGPKRGDGNDAKGIRVRADYVRRACAYRACRANYYDSLHVNAYYTKVHRTSP